MEILIAKSAGFCFGVQNAVKRAEAVGGDNKDVYTYGPLIHNNEVVEKLKSEGIGVINNLDEVKQGDKIIIRSHGISKAEYEKLKDKKAMIIDATCPYVSSIHRIVEERYNSGYKIIIIGDKEHPEVKGVNGWCNEEGIIIDNEEDVIKINGKFKKICIVTQTTYNQEKWRAIVKKLVDAAIEVLIYNTVCSATQIRQNEAQELSKKVDAMIVIGGRQSSNTKKLYDICKESCPKTIFIENESELNPNELSEFNTIGITAGASTPEYIINNVVFKLNTSGEFCNKNDMKEGSKTMEENMKNYSEEEKEYFNSFKKMYTGDIVEGKVIAVNDNEVFVDIGYKSDGILPVSEVTGVDINLKEKFKPGDILKVGIIAMNDGEGNVLLSRKEVEKDEFIKQISEYKEQEKVIEVTIKDSNKGGFTCLFANIRAFMPKSLSGIGISEDPNSYVGKKVKVQIAEIKEKRGDIELIVSRKAIVKKEMEKKRNEAIEKLEAGDVCNGIVKAIIKSGIFVNIGDIDVFVPISELSWKRIKTPNDVVKENDKAEILITKVNKEEMKVSGSIKRLLKEPWEDFIEKYKVDELIEGKVVRFADFGAFVELMDGVDGLIHISNIADRRINKPQEVLKIGQVVKTKIIKIDLEEKKISLSIKDAE